jgi:hypothetical protein
MKTTRPAPAGQGTYAELDGGNTFTGEQTINGDLTVNGEIENNYPVVPYSPSIVFPLRRDLVPSHGSDYITFSRSTKASWIDYDGVVRWSMQDVPRFSGTRWDDGAILTTDEYGNLIPDDFAPLGTILFIGDSQCAGTSSYSKRLVFQMRGATISEDCLGGRSLATMASEITTTLETYAPDILVVEGGYNDVTVDTAETMLGHIDTIVSACVQYGAEPILMEMSPMSNFAGWDAGDQTNLDNFNVGLNTLSDTYGYKLVKLYQSMEDPDTPDALLPAYEIAAGNIHWNVTGSRFVANEILNVFDHKYVKGLLVEAETINQAIYSQDFTNGAWVQPNMATASNSISAPDLSITADTLTASAGDATLLQTYTIASADFCFSVWLKRKTGTGTIYITIDGGTTLLPVSVDDTWRRFFVTNEAAEPSFGVQIATNTDAVYAWGGQLEARTFPTSYFQTVAAADTRGGDISYFASTGLDTTIGSRVATFAPLWSLQEIFDIGVSERVDAMSTVINAAEDVRFISRIANVYKYDDDGGVQFIGYNSPAIGSLPSDFSPYFMAKLGFTFSTTGENILLYSDGVTNSAKTDIVDFQSSMGNIYIGGSSTGVRQLNGYLKNITYYNAELTESQMHEITGW